ncbi:hypothetical protein N0V82_003841 [Gnomoniopsis sp. IMI 355080]|nr:hypothetical protein N0V82_003841 [Gnomoniopsis sp. IMI 355080]
MAVPKDGEQHQGEPWMRYLDDEIKDFEKGSVDENATVIIRDVLAADSISEAKIKEAALQLDKYDKSVCLAYDPLETMTGPDYSDTLSGDLEKDWNGIFPNMRSDIDNEESRATFRQMCDEWLNFSAFKARTLVAGICAHYPEWSFKAPLKDINIGLGLRDDVLGGDVFTDCMLMVAAQHILIAGEAIRSQFTEDKGYGKGLDQTRWKLWAERFHEGSKSEGYKPDTRLAAGKAHEKMMALWPEIFPNPDLPVTIEADN